MSRVTEITPELARQDIEKVMDRFGTIGLGTEPDRAAQLVVQTMQVVRNRLGDKDILRILYVNNPDAGKFLPGVVMDTVRRVVSGEVNAEEAGVIIDDVLPQYGEAFRQLGVKPERVSVLFINDPAGERVK